MILVFGSLNMDLIVPVPHLPRPGETVLSPAHATAPGGKGANQAVAAARAGADVVMVGCVGRDAFGDELLEIVSAAGVDTRPIEPVNAPTGVAVVCVADEAGYIVRSLVACENIHRVPLASSLGSLAAVSALKPWPGIAGVICLGSDTSASFRLEARP